MSVLFRLFVLAAIAGTATTATADEVVVPPTAHCPVQAVYPPAELPDRVAGTVTVRITLDAEGVASELAIAASLGPAFDRATMEALHQCTFTAATRDGVALPSVIETAVRFVPPPPPTKVHGEIVGDLGVPVGGALVRVAHVETKTDDGGRFSVELDLAGEPPELDVAVVAAGYEAVVAKERIVPGEARRLYYRLQGKNPYEVRVTGNRLLPPLPKVDPTPTVSRFEITRADIDRTPGALEDINRVVATLPGVVADPDLLATFFVRGGGPDEVIFYLDGVPLSNPFHLGGFASIFNPMLIDSAQFYAGGTPANYEPALSGALDVRYLPGEAKRLRLVADVSMNTAKALAEVPTGIDGLSALVAARRSYYEVYFAALGALGITGANYVAPDIGEYLGRLHYRRGRHELSLTYQHSTDGLSFLIEPGEQVLVDFAGGLTIANTMDLGIFQDRIDLGEKRELRLVVAGTRESNETAVSSETSFETDVKRFDALARADLLLPLNEQHALKAGLQYAYRGFSFTGQVDDERAIAPWSARPLVDTGAPNVPIAPSTRENVLAAYLDHQFKPTPALSLEAGGRLQGELGSQRIVHSARVAAAYALPTMTVLKLSAGETTQSPTNPLLRDAAYGNGGLLPERSRQVIFGLEQPLPFEAYVRLEGWAKWLDRLAANPDTVEGVQALVAAGRPVFQSVGSGFARGTDLLFMGRTSLRTMGLSYGLSAGLVWSDRTNPLAATVRDYPAAYDQRFTMATNFALSPGNGWLVSARFSFHTGRPYTPVTGFVRDDANQRYLPMFGATNGARNPNFYEASVRAEKRFRLGPIPMAWYAEVLNVTNAQNVFTYLYDDGDFATGRLPERGEFRHLPLRPFLGIRGEY